MTAALKYDDWLEAHDTRTLKVPPLRLVAQLYLVIDYETRSRADLKIVGAYEYAKHKSTRITSVAWRLGTFEQLKAGTTQTKHWCPFFPSAYGEFKRAMLDPNIILVAHNAMFEQCVTKFVLPRLIHDERLKEIPVERWICTMSMARALALPAKLENVTEGLKLAVTKDMEGHRHMLKMSKPRKPTKNNPAKWVATREDFERLGKYNVNDVDAEVALFIAIPQLTPEERRVWIFDQKINLRGFRCDRPLILKILRLIREESARFKTEALRLTHGEIDSLNKRNKILAWLKREHSIELPDLKANTVSDFLNAPPRESDGVALLRLRLDAAKAAVKKYDAFERRSRSDGRIRNTLGYHVAGTGRWGGQGLNPQNLFVPTLGMDMNRVAEIVADPDVDLEMIRMLFGNPMEVFASLCRSVILPSLGKRMISGDFSGIEVCVLFWIAKHEDGLRALRDGRNLYCEQASDIYGFEVVKGVDNDEYDVGKRTVLGAGFNMGPPRFVTNCAQFGTVVSDKLAQKAIASYRRKHWPVAKLWSNLQKAAIAAVKNPGKRYSLNYTSWWVADDFLWCRLPSGRKLAYYKPHVAYKKMKWGLVPELRFWDAHPKTGKLFRNHTYGGKLTENVVQATARDFMVSALFDLEADGFEMLFTVHDEPVTERDEWDETGTLEDFKKIMAKGTEWGKGCPIKAGAWQGPRYRKA